MNAKEYLSQAYRLDMAINTRMQEVDRLVALKEEIGRVIRQVDDDLCEMVLTKRYLCYMQWEEIAREMHYSRRWVMNLHQRGIEAVEGILEFR